MGGFIDGNFVDWLFVVIHDDSPNLRDYTRGKTFCAQKNENALYQNRTDVLRLKTECHYH